MAYECCDLRAIEQNSRSELRFLLESFRYLFENPNMATPIEKSDNEDDMNDEHEHGQARRRSSQGRERDRTDTSLYCNEQTHFRQSMYTLSSAFSAALASECIAHKAALELTLFLILQGQLQGLGDIYRFIVMEENRHVELEEGATPIPAIFHIDVLLTSIATQLLANGYLSVVVALQKEIRWEWVQNEFPAMEPVDNFCSAITRLRVMTNMKQQIPEEAFMDVTMMSDSRRQCMYFIRKTVLMNRSRAADFQRIEVSLWI